MPNRKLFVHGTVIAVSFRAEEGLPLPASPLVEAVFESVLARAQSLYPVVICHFLVMSNHVHMLLVVHDPGCVSAFVGYVKAETAHAVNHLLGRKKHTIWADGFDSPIVLDAEKAKQLIVYIYNNPVQANLVERIEDYPHLSTWQAFLAGGQERIVWRIPRDSIPVLPRRSLGLKEQELLAQQIRIEALEECCLVISPDAWMDCFDELRDIDPEEVNQEIIDSIRAKEGALNRARTGPVMGAHALRLEPINKEYEPKKRGKRMVCLSSLKELRKVFICWYRELCAEALQMRQAVDWMCCLPPGMFAPGGALRANLTPIFVPTANTVVLYN